MPPAWTATDRDSSKSAGDCHWDWNWCARTYLGRPPPRRPAWVFRAAAARSPGSRRVRRPGRAEPARRPAWEPRPARELTALLPAPAVAAASGELAGPEKEAPRSAHPDHA